MFYCETDFYFIHISEIQVSKNENLIRVHYTKLSEIHKHFVATFINTK